MNISCSISDIDRYWKIIGIYIERFTGFVSDWSILNIDWAIKKFDLLTLIYLLTL